MIGEYQMVTDSEQQAMAQAAMQYHEEQKLERLRDEFAIEIIGKLVQKLNFDGMYREEFKGDSVMLGQAAYLIADAALKAREQSK